jgi:hypothetical protein
VIFRRRRRLSTRELKRQLAALGKAPQPTHIAKPLAELEAVLREAQRRNRHH